MGANDKLAATFHGPFEPNVTTICKRLDAARAKLAALPRPSLLEAAKTALPWENNEAQASAAVADAEAEVKQLFRMLAIAERAAVQHVIDLLECIPQDRENFTIVREALLYARALARVEEQMI